MGIEISLCMIVKNEENNLSRCLDSVKTLVDEINIVDTGSTDDTLNIAKQYTDRIYHFNWIKDFSAARNFSFSKATKEYILWLDADDTILEEDLSLLKELKENLNESVDCILISYNYSQDEFGNPDLVQLRERILKRDSNPIWIGAVHERIDISNYNCNTREDIYIKHNKAASEELSSKARNLDILKAVIESGKAKRRDYYYYGLSLFRENKYDEAIEYLELFFNDKFDFFTGIDAYMAAYAIYIDKKDYEKAYKLLALNEKLLMDKSEYYCMLGDFYFNVLKDTKKAIEMYKKALKCHGSESGTGNILKRHENYYYYYPYYYLGKCYSKLNLKEQAVKSFNSALKYKPEDSIALDALRKI